MDLYVLLTHTFAKHRTVLQKYEANVVNAMLYTHTERTPILLLSEHHFQNPEIHENDIYTNKNKLKKNDKMIKRLKLKLNSLHENKVSMIQRKLMSGETSSQKIAQDTEVNAITENQSHINEEIRALREQNTDLKRTNTELKIKQREDYWSKASEYKNAIFGIFHDIGNQLCASYRSILFVLEQSNFLPSLPTLTYDFTPHEQCFDIHAADIRLVGTVTRFFQGKRANDPIWNESDYKPYQPIKQICELSRCVYRTNEIKKDVESFIHLLFDAYDFKTNTKKSFVKQFNETYAHSKTEFIRFVVRYINSSFIHNTEKYLPLFMDESMDFIWSSMDLIARRIHHAFRILILYLSNKLPKIDDLDIEIKMIEILAGINDIFLCLKLIEQNQYKFCIVWYGEKHIENIENFLTNEQYTKNQLIL